MSEVEVLKSKDFPIGETRWIINIKQTSDATMQVFIWEEVVKDDVNEYILNYLLKNAEVCKIDPYCFSVMVVTPQSELEDVGGIKLIPNAPFFARKVKEQTSKGEVTSIILSRVDKSHCDW